MGKYVSAIATYLVGVYTGNWAPFAAAVFGTVQQERAARRARKAWNDSQRDVQAMIKGGVQPREIAYGRVCKSGTWVYASTAGTKSEELWAVMALAGHECDAVESYYLNDTAVTVDGAGSVQTPPWAALSNATWFSEQLTVPASAPYRVTLSRVPNAVLGVFASVTSSAGISGWTWTPGSNQVTLTAAQAGQSLYFSYHTGVATSYAALRPQLGSTTQAAWPALVAAKPAEWTTNHRLRGICALGIALTFNETAFATGIPQIKVVLRGKKLLDPRTSTTAWSNNAALVAYDYMISPQGLNIAAAKIDTASVIAAANVCDESVQVGASTFQARYTFDGVIREDDDPARVKAMLEEAMAGRISYSQGKWRLRAGSVATPTFTITESMLTTRRPVRIVPFVSRAALINRVKGTFTSPAANYAEDQFPEWTSSTLVTEDGGRDLVETVSFPWVSDSARAQRMAKIAALRSREGLTYEISTDLRCWKLQAGDTVYCKSAHLGWDSLNSGAGKLFRVLDRTFHAEDGVALLLQEETQSLYDWNYLDTKAYTPSPNTTLPAPATVPTPTITTVASGPAQALVLGDGTVIPRIRIALAAPTDVWVNMGGRVEVEWLTGDFSTSTAAWTPAPAVPATETQLYIAPALDGMLYQIRVRYRNALGAVGAWAFTTHTVTGRTSAPAATVSALGQARTSSGLRRFTWTCSSPDLDLEGFELRYAAGGTITWASAALAGVVPAYPKPLGGVYSLETSIPGGAGTYSFEVRAVNSSGVAGTSGAQLLNQALPAAGTLEGVNLLLNPDFSESDGTNSGATCCRGWSFGTLVTGATLGRNYADGARYNVGRGGAYLAMGNTEVGTADYALIEQVVQFSTTGSVEMEASIYYAAHRCQATPVYVYAKNSGGSVVGSWSFNTSNSSSGDTFDPVSGGADGPTPGAAEPMARAWVKFTPPATTVSLTFRVMAYATIGSATSAAYLFLHRAMLCRASSNATAATPTPWADSPVSGLDGRTIDPATVLTNALGLTAVSSSSSVTDATDVWASNADSGRSDSVTLTMSAAEAGWLLLQYKATAFRANYSGGGLSALVGLKVTDNVGVVTYGAAGDCVNGAKMADALLVRYPGGSVDFTVTVSVLASGASPAFTSSNGMKFAGSGGGVGSAGLTGGTIVLTGQLYKR